MKNNIYITGIFINILVISMLLTGCSSQTSDNGEDIELLEPVGITETYVTVERKDLISYSTYSGVVIPSIKEAFFTTNQNFYAYGVLPGSDIKYNIPFVYASTEKVDKEIDSLKEVIDKSVTDFDEFLTDSGKQKRTLESEIESNGDVVKAIDELNDSEKAFYMNGLYQKYKNIFLTSTASLERLEENIKERTDLFNLDKKYNEIKLQRLVNKKNSSLALSSSDGTVVSINYFDDNQYVNKDIPVGAVGDFNELMIVTDRVQTGDIKRALEYYALINGKRYEVSFIEPDTQGLAAATQGSEAKKTYSKFVFTDKNIEVSAGDFATIVVIMDDKKDVLAIPNSVIESDGADKFVRKMDGDNAVSTQVKTGIRSGFYTEIISGLNEGDKVVGEFKVEDTKSEIVLSRGSVGTNNKISGYVYYPKSETVKNEIKHGITYLDEICVKQYQRVNKGDVLATVHVISDDIELKRLERSIFRANEDLSELQKQDAEKNEKLIKAKTESINKMQEQVDEIKADANTTKIVSPISGIVTYVMRKEEGDILLSDFHIASVASEANSFIIVEDSNGAFTYGNEAIVEYKDSESNAKTAYGKVVTVTPWALSSELNTGYALIQVPADDLEQIVSSNRGADGWWYRTRVDVSIRTRGVDDVIVVPKSSVYLENGMHYVIVKDSNGNSVYKSFLSGGSDNFNYWVIDGLTEGMTICSK